MFRFAPYCLKKQSKLFFHNFVKFSPTFLIFGTKMAKMIELYKVDLFSTSINLCQCTTMWNTDAPNCYILQWLFVSDCSLLHYQFDRGRHVIY